MGAAYQCDWCGTLYAIGRSRVEDVDVGSYEDIGHAKLYKFTFGLTVHSADKHGHYGDPDLCFACQWKGLELLINRNKASDD